METEENNKNIFKKPSFIGKIRKKIPKKTENLSDVEQDIEITSEKPETEKESDQLTETNVGPEAKLAFSYDPPPWSGLPQTNGKKYKLEVLKNGQIIEVFDLMEKSCWVLGRLPDCDLYLQHPSVSRYHLVLQYRGEADETNPAGFYLYDLNSIHGTFLNKKKITAKTYTRIQVGHILKLGYSSRQLILDGPEDDAEEESPLTVTELKAKHKEDLERYEEAKKVALRELAEKEEKTRKEIEERGIDWGMGEDANEEEDLTENPYAQTNNEELFIDNPKKALRGFFEREGLDLEYDCTEVGKGFVCRIELPIDDKEGRPIVAQAMHAGKKKEAVVQCALEACRILDKHNLLRQATHESRKRKPKNWEENDYYDSDEDTFLDRTGTIEKKRQLRMKTNTPKAETYESLVVKEKDINNKILDLQKQLLEAQKLLETEEEAKPEDDSLDSFMNELNKSKIDKQSLNRMKSELSQLKQEHSRIVQLVNITKPANLPPLVINYDKAPNLQANKNKILPIFGKRRKVKVEIPKKSTETVESNIMADNEEEIEEEEEKIPRMQKVENNKEKQRDETNKTETNKLKEEKLDVKRKVVSLNRDEEDMDEVKDVSKKDMWLPPSDQSGDGKTKLNEKYGY